MHFVVLCCIITFHCTVQKTQISLLNLSLHSEFILNKYFFPHEDLALPVNMFCTMSVFEKKVKAVL